MIKQIRDKFEILQIVQDADIFKTICRHTDYMSYLKELEKAYFFTVDGKAIFYVFYRKPFVVEIHGYTYPEHRAESVELGLRFVEHLRKIGCKKVTTEIPSKYKAMQNYMRKRLGFTQDGEHFYRELSE